jgi:hypothetical protein
MLAPPQLAGLRRLGMRQMCSMASLAPRSTIAHLVAGEMASCESLTTGCDSKDAVRRPRALSLRTGARRGFASSESVLTIS